MLQWKAAKRRYLLCAMTLDFMAACLSMAAVIIVVSPTHSTTV